MLRLKLNHVSKSGPWCYSMHWGYRWQVKFMTITYYHCGNTVCNSICHTFSCNMRVYSTIIQLPQHPLWKYKYTQMLGFHTHWEPKFFYIWYMDEMDIQYDILSLRNCKLTKYCYFVLSNLTYHQFGLQISIDFVPNFYMKLKYRLYVWHEISRSYIVSLIYFDNNFKTKIDQ